MGSWSVAICWFPVLRSDGVALTRGLRYFGRIQKHNKMADSPPWVAVRFAIKIPEGKVKLATNLLGIGCLRGSPFHSWGAQAAIQVDGGCAQRPAKRPQVFTKARGSFPIRMVVAVLKRSGNNRTDPLVVSFLCHDMATWVSSTPPSPSISLQYTKLRR